MLILGFKICNTYKIFENISKIKLKKKTIMDKNNKQTNQMS